MQNETWRLMNKAMEKGTKEKGRKNRNKRKKNIRRGGKVLCRKDYCFLYFPPFFFNKKGPRNRKKDRKKPSQAEKMRQRQKLGTTWPQFCPAVALPICVCVCGASVRVRACVRE
jgi:hypothetical protein